MKSLAIILADMANDIYSTECELANMSLRWETLDDPASDPGLQYEQSSKIDEMYVEFEKFSRTQLFLRRTDNLDKWVIRYDDGSYNLKDSSGYATPFIDEANLYDSKENAEENAATLVGVDKIMKVRDTTS